jgi:S-adenosylmethionine uptake transporter
LVATVVAAAIVPFGASSDYNAWTTIALLAIGILGLFAQLAMTRAFSSGQTTLLASLQYSTVAFAAIYGIVLWGDTLSMASVVGLSLIVFSGILALRRVREPIQLDA